MKAAFNKKHFLKIYKNLYLYRYQNVSTQTDQITNEFGVQMINEKYRSLIFGEKKEKNDNDIEKAKKHLQSFELDNKKVEILNEFQDFEMPKFKS